MQDTIHRFLNKVIDTGSGCWIWANKDGKPIKTTGNFRFNGSIQLAYRASYQIYIGDIPAKMCVCHSCDNPSCVNPFHLWLGTQSENLQDMLRKGRGTAYKHGEIRMYTNRGCRCGLCVESYIYWKHFLLPDYYANPKKYYNYVHKRFGKLWRLAES